MSKGGVALWAHGCRGAAIGVVAALDGNLIGNEFGIVPNPPDKGRSAPRKPWQPQKINARHAAHAALVLGAALRIERIGL